MTVLNADLRAKKAQWQIGAYVTIETGLGIAFSIILILFLLLQPVLLTHDPMASDLSQRFKPPGTAGHWLGTDELGRDVWSRTLTGLNWSLSAALIATLISSTLGTILGLLAAQSSGVLQTLIRQTVNTVLSFPGLIVAICVIAVFEQGYWPLVLTLGFLTWPVFSRVVYAEALSLLERDYVLSAQLIGVSRFRILCRHVLPGLRPTLMVMLAFHFADMLIAESALSYLGLSAPLDEPTWGNMLAASRARLMDAPWMMLAPAVAIIFAVVTANLLGDGLASLSRRHGKGIDM